MRTQAALFRAPKFPPDRPAPESFSPGHRRRHCARVRLTTCARSSRRGLDRSCYPRARRCWRSWSIFHSRSNRRRRCSSSPPPCSRCRSDWPDRGLIPRQIRRSDRASAGCAPRQNTPVRPRPWSNVGSANRHKLVYSRPTKTCRQIFYRTLRSRFSTDNFP